MFCSTVSKNSYYNIWKSQKKQTNLLTQNCRWLKCLALRTKESFHPPLVRGCSRASAELLAPVSTWCLETPAWENHPGVSVCRNVRRETSSCSLSNKDADYIDLKAGQEWGKKFCYTLDFCEMGLSRSSVRFLCSLAVRMADVGLSLGLN